MPEKITVTESSIEDAFKINKEIPEFRESEMEYSKDYFEQRYKNKETVILTARIEDKPAGYLIAYDKYGDGSIYCWMAGVIPEMRNKGVLTAMMSYLASWAKSRGYKKIRIKTRNNRLEMLKFLTSRAYNIIEITPKENPEENRILFEKEL